MALSISVTRSETCSLEEGAATIDTGLLLKTQNASLRGGQ